ncbi:MAG TPA: sigma factor, partial [Longimicrobiaceae bacterium]
MIGRVAVEGALEAFERERGRLFGAAYRMLGSAREAEDVLQDAWMRWQGVDHAQVQNPAAYLVRLVTRLCIDA